jgi:uncharacterized membrane protein
MLNLTLYYDPKLENSQRLFEDLERIKHQSEFHITRIDVTKDLPLYGDMGPFPVIKIGPYTLQGEITAQQIQVAVGAAMDRDRNLRQLGDKRYEKKINRGKKLSGPDRITLLVSKKYMFLFNFVVFLYIGLPFLAPVLMNAGATFPAQIIYKVYRPLCHQLTFRSFFLYGDQLVYPRELAQVPDVIPYEEYFHQDHLDINFARDFLGNEQAGYKVALCERDIAIYGSFLIFGILFQLFGRKFRRIPWYIWILVGIIPMGLDGTSQLPGLMANILPAWVPLRESTPIIRVITGVLFGITTAWYLYPIVEETMNDTRLLLTQKKNYVEQSKVEAETEVDA